MKRFRIHMCTVIVWIFFLNGVSIANNISIINVGTGQVEVNGMSVSTTIGCVEGSGVAKAEKRDVPSFTAIEVGGSFNANIECQKKQGLEVSGDDNILPLIITRVDNGVLHIDIAPNKSICPKTQLLVKITAINIENISAMGTNVVSISQLNNKNFAVYASGSGSISASGKTSEFTVNIRGSSNLNAKDLCSEEVNIAISGVADAVIYASKKLQAQISGVGNIIYYGNPGEMSKNITGVGHIEQKESN